MQGVIYLLYNKKDFLKEMLAKKLQVKGTQKW